MVCVCVYLFVCTNYYIKGMPKGMPRGSQPYARKPAEKQVPTKFVSCAICLSMLCIQQRTVGGEHPKERAACPPRTLLDQSIDLFNIKLSLQLYLLQFSF